MINIRPSRALRAPQFLVGFSMIELVIVMLIIGLLAAVGLPSYQRYTSRGNRAAAKAFLTDLAQRQESFFSDRRRYARTLTDLGYVDSSSGSSLDTSVSIDEKGNLYATAVPGKSLYRVSLVASAATTGTGTATSVRTCAGLDASVPPVAGLKGYSIAWTALAVPESPQDKRDVGCSTLCLNGTGRQGATGSDGWQTCWRG